MQRFFLSMESGVSKSSSTYSHHQLVLSQKFTDHLPVTNLWLSMSRAFSVSWAYTIMSFHFHNTYTRSTQCCICRDALASVSKNTTVAWLQYLIAFCLEPCIEHLLHIHNIFHSNWILLSLYFSSLMWVMWVQSVLFLRITQVHVCYVDFEKSLFYIMKLNYLANIK